MGCLIPGLLFLMITVPGLALGLLVHPWFFLILVLLIVLLPRVIFGSQRN